MVLNKENVNNSVFHLYLNKYKINEYYLIKLFCNHNKDIFYSYLSETNLYKYALKYCLKKNIDIYIITLCRFIKTEKNSIIFLMKNLIKYKKYDIFTKIYQKSQYDNLALNKFIYYYGHTEYILNLDNINYQCRTKSSIYYFLVVDANTKLENYFKGDNIYSKLNQEKWIEFYIKKKIKRSILIKKSVKHNMIKLLCFILNDDENTVEKILNIKKLHKFLDLNDIMIIYNTVKTEKFINSYDNIFDIFFNKNKLDVVKYLFENDYTNYKIENIIPKLNLHNKDIYDYFINLNVILEKNI